MPVEVLVPPLGTTVDTLTLVAWYKQEGETVQKGEPLFAVETDKATLDVEAPESGVLCQVTCAPGTEVATLSRIAIISAPGEARNLQQPELSGHTSVSDVSETRYAASAGSTATTVLRKHSGTGRQERVFISPRAKRLAVERGLEWLTLQGTGPEGAIVERDVVAALETARPKAITPVAQRMAEEAGVDWTRLTGSGPGGKVRREDVGQAIAAQRAVSPEPPAEEAEFETLPMEGVRAVIAARMLQSATTTAPVTLTVETDATALVELRTQLRTDGVSVSYNDLLLTILARALREHPRLNASLHGEMIRVWKRVHIGLAVDAERGLLVPVVRDVDRKGLTELARETAALVEAARTGNSLPDDLRGGTFTLTNLGMFGIDAFTPVLNLPECAILGVGRIQPQPSVVGAQIVVRQKMWLSLTFDHRLVDGGPAARFLQRVTQLIEKPHLLLS